MAKKAAIYARVSGDRQKKEETIESQLDILNEYAIREGFTVPEQWVFLDEGVTGINFQRPALDELRDLIRVENIDTVLVYSPDRLAREYGHQLILKHEFEKNGVEINFIKNPKATTAEEKMLEHFQGIFAEYERMQILDRSRRGRIYKAKQGNPAILPSIAYGYKRFKNGNSTHVEIDPDAAAVVKEIFRFYVYEGLSLSGIVQRLGEQGIPPVKGGLKWDRSTIKGIIENTAYIGTAYYGKTERSKGQMDRIRRYKTKRIIKPKYARTKTSQEKWFPINVPSIILESDFELAQEKLKTNKTFSTRNTKEISLLQGLLTCGECGQPYYKKVRNYRTKRVSYYCCRSHLEKGLRKCSNRTLYQKEMDDMVFEGIIDLLKNPNLITQEIARRAKEATNTDQTNKKEVTLLKDLNKLNQERDRLIDAYQTGVLDLKGLQGRHQSLNKRKNDLEGELKILEALKFEQEQKVDIEVLFQQFTKRVNVSSQSLSLEEKRKIVRLLISEVVVDVKNVTIRHCISPRMLEQDESPLSLGGRQRMVTIANNHREPTLCKLIK